MPCARPWTSPEPPSPSPQAGAVLVVLLVILAAVAGIALQDAATTWEDAQEARMLAEQYQADLLAESCLQHALARLAEDDSPEWDTLSDVWATPLTGDDFRVLILPANALLNPNLLPMDKQTQDCLKRLVPSLLHPETAFRCLYDWVDSDADELATGCEKSAYRQTAPSYRPPNRNMQSARELLLVEGFQELRNSTALQYWSVWGSPPLNINFVPAELLLAYAPELAGARSRILAARRGKGIRSAEEMYRVTGESPPEEEDPEYLSDDVPKWTISSNVFFVEIETLTGTLYHKRRYIVRRNAVGQLDGLTMLGVERLETRVARPEDQDLFLNPPATLDAVYNTRWNNASAF